MDHSELNSMGGKNTAGKQIFSFSKLNLLCEVMLTDLGGSLIQARTNALCLLPSSILTAAGGPWLTKGLAAGAEAAPRFFSTYLLDEPNREILWGWIII